jgi:hypothetical protein
MVPSIVPIPNAERGLDCLGQPCATVGTPSASHCGYELLRVSKRSCLRAYQVSVAAGARRAAELRSAMGALITNTRTTSASALCAASVAFMNTTTESGFWMIRSPRARPAAGGIGTSGAGARTCTCIWTMLSTAAASRCRRSPTPRFSRPRRKGGTLLMFSICVQGPHRLPRAHGRLRLLLPALWF